MGDVCEFLCAVGFMCHILTVEHFAKEDGIKLSCIQFAVCAILSGVMMLLPKMSILPEYVRQDFRFCIRVYYRAESPIPYRLSDRSTHRLR